MAGNSLNIFKPKPGSYLDRLHKSRFLLTQMGQQGDTDALRITNLLQVGKGKKKGADVKNQLSNMGGKKFFQSNMDDKANQLAIELSKQAKTDAKGNQSRGHGKLTLARAKQMWEDIGGNVDSLKGFGAREGGQITNLIAYLLSVPQQNPQLEKDGFTQDFEGEVSSIYSALPEKDWVATTFPTTKPPASVGSQQSVDDEPQDAKTKKRMEIMMFNQGMKEAQGQGDFRKAANLASAKRGLTSELERLTRIEADEKVRQQRKATTRANNKLANGEAEAQGAGAAAQSSLFMSQSSFSALAAQSASEATGPDGGVASVRSLPSRDSLFDSFRSEAKFQSSILSAPPLSSQSTGTPFSNQFLNDVAGPSLGMSFGSSGTQQSSSVGPAPPLSESFTFGSSSTGPAPPLSEEFSFGPSSGSSFGQQPRPPPSTGPQSYGSAQEQYNALVGAVAAGDGGGGAAGPNNNQLNEQDRDARLARMIAEQNAKLAVAIMKSQKKKGSKPFLSTEDMNLITTERNMDARQMKAEGLFKDYQNSNNQDTERLMELQREYNDLYRVPMAR